MVELALKVNLTFLLLLGTNSSRTLQVDPLPLNDCQLGGSWTRDIRGCNVSLRQKSVTRELWWHK